jgi:hypothetical protein
VSGDGRRPRDVRADISRAASAQAAGCRALADVSRDDGRADPASEDPSSVDPARISRSARAEIGGASGCDSTHDIRRRHRPEQVPAGSRGDESKGALHGLDLS